MQPGDTKNPWENYLDCQPVFLNEGVTIAADFVYFCNRMCDDRLLGARFVSEYANFVALGRAFLEHAKKLQDEKTRIAFPHSFAKKDGTQELWICEVEARTTEGKNVLIFKEEE